MDSLMSKSESTQNMNKSFPRVHILTALDYGGSERQMLNLAAYYKDAGKIAEVSFVALAGRGRIGKLISDLGFQVFYLNQPPIVPNLKIVFGLMSIIKKIRPNLIITNGIEANFHGIIAAKFANVKSIIIEEVGVAKYRSTTRFVLKFIYRFAKCCFVGSSLVYNSVISQGLLPSSKIVIVHPPLEEFTKTKMPLNQNIPENISFLFVGRLEEVKGVSQLIGALKILKEEYNLTNWKLNVVGDGSQESKLKLQSHASGLSNFITFHSSTNLVQQFIDKCDFLVQPSISEGMGYSLLEALTSGKPVITTLVGVAPEVVQDGINGYVCAQSTNILLSQKMRLCFDLNSEEYTRMCEAAWSTDFSDFTSEKYMARIDCAI